MSPSFLRRIQHSGFLLPAALTGYLWLKGDSPHLPGWSCPLRALCGVPCPTCFLTRATGLALRGDLTQAWSWHPLAPVVAAGLLVWSVAALRQRRLMPLRSPPWWLLGALGALLLAVWLVRLPAWLSVR